MHCTCVRTQIKIQRVKGLLVSWDKVLLKVLICRTKMNVLVWRTEKREVDSIHTQIQMQTQIQNKKSTLRFLVSSKKFISTSKKCISITYCGVTGANTNTIMNAYSR